MHQYVVKNPRDAVRALSAMIPGFAKEMMTSGDRGIRYAVFVGKRNINEKQLEHPSGANEIRIAPMMGGKKAGLFQTILGAVLMVVGAVVGVMTSWTGIGAQIGVGMMMMGAGMMLGGISQMISRQQQTPQSSLQSYNFNGAQNTTYQGGPVPLLYGRMMVGSTVISEGLLAQDGTAQLVGGNYVPTISPPPGG